MQKSLKKWHFYFGWNRIINIEVIEEIILGVTDFRTAPQSMQHKKLIIDFCNL